MIDRVQWVESAGGPLLLLAEDLLGFWDGIEAPPKFREVTAEFRWKERGVATDYDRACDVQDYVGLIDVGPGAGLVLGDEPLPTSWIALSEKAGLLVRCRFAEDDLDLLPILGPALNHPGWETALTFVVEADPLVLFDAARPGRKIESPLPVRLSCGKYRVSTLEYTPHAETSLLLHQLSRDD